MKRLLYAVALLSAVPVVAEKPVPSLRDLSRATMVEGFDALDVRDYPKARDRFVAVQTVLDQRPMESDTYEDRAIRVVVAYVSAKAIGDGKLGDPCPGLRRAHALDESAAILAKREPKVDHERELGDEADRDIRDAQVKFGCAKGPPAEKGLIAVKLAGHYYLSGVMETGSELMLKPDGAYEYYISYGAMDQFSQGTWQQVADAVILTHTKTPSGGPLFKLDSLEPWDVDAEDYIQTARHEVHVAAVEAVCPFLAEPVINENTPPPVVTAQSVSPVTGDEPKVDYALIYGRAKATEEQLRRTYERAAQAAMMSGNNNPDRDDSARSARYTWQSARNDLGTARNDADSTDALPPVPVLPAICKVSEAITASEIPEKNWVRGFGVIVGDPVAGAKFSNVTVRFHFADGKIIDAKTQRRGFAWVEKQTGNAVAAVSVSYQREGREDAPFERFAIGNGAEGVQRVIIDSRQLVQPPFDEMRLTIRDGNLLGPGGRGRYSKGN